MKAITKDYLLEVVFRAINKTINIHRESKKNTFYYEPFPTATDEEMLDFIQSIPYFDLGLKNFLLGNMVEKTIIISQAWELEYLKKTIAWAESFEWLHGNDYFLSEAHISGIKKGVSFLTLPY